MLTKDAPEKLPVDNIDIPERLRPLNSERVDDLMVSLERLGLQIPITVYGSGDGASVSLVTGRHRLEAARRLGWEEIDVIFLYGTSDELRLWEIAENLHRSELTPLQRCEHIAEWMRLTVPSSNQKKEVSAQVEPKHRAGGRPESGVRAAARLLGVDRNEAQRAVKIDSIDPETKQELRDKGLDRNQTFLLKVASVPIEERKILIKVEGDKPLIQPKTYENEKAAVAFLKQHLGSDFDEFANLFDRVEPQTFKRYLRG